MKIFLSSLEGVTVKGRPFSEILVENKVPMHYNLMSYYYLKNKKAANVGEFIRDHTDEILIDSGAHSLRHGKKVDFVEYTKQYAEFIKNFDRPNVVGYFEMDVDNVIGYDKVLELRKILESVSDKIIPVWHRNRGIEDFKKMCRDYAGKVVAITGFANVEIKDEQYIMFLKYARKYNCRVHCLGMTRKKVLDTVPFDYVDSSTWIQATVYGRVDNKGKRADKTFQREHTDKIYLANYMVFTKKQEEYHEKWKKICED